VVLGLAVSTISLVLLGASGIVKIFDPAPTSGALEVARLPSSDAISRLIGVVELGAAILGLTRGGVAVVAAAVLYAVFTLFTLAAVRRRIPLQSCGCFGRDDTPPTAIHVSYNAVATIALTWLAISDATPVPRDSTPLELVLFLSFAALGAIASYLLLARLPSVLKISGAR
jgi:hypothetical protein